MLYRRTFRSDGSLISFRPSSSPCACGFEHCSTAGILWRIVVVSSRHSAALVYALKNERRWFGAADTIPGRLRAHQWLDTSRRHALRDAPPRTESLQGGFRSCAEDFNAAEQRATFIGSEIEQKLKELDRGVPIARPEGPYKGRSIDRVRDGAENA
jgi:hypothetical protein